MNTHHLQGPEAFMETNLTSSGNSEHPIVQHSRPLIENLPNAGFAKPHVDALVEALAEITGISAEDDLGETLGMNLDSGVALSPVQAAKCLKDLMRTHTFIHAVARAIQDQLAQKTASESERIDILYAGTGPYGLLLLPVLAALNDDRIRATLIDIHAENIQGVRQVVGTLNIGHLIHSIVLDDATQWEPSEGLRFDIILSETMNWMLKNEPQVKIFSHLEQYLRNQQSTFIPQQIILDARLYNAGQFNEYRLGNRDKPEETTLGVFACVNRASVQKIADGCTDVLDHVINIPTSTPQDHSSLKLCTELQVYRDLWLKENQSSLNISLSFDKRYFNNGDSIRLKYDFGSLSDGTRPGYQIHFPKKAPPAAELISDDEVGHLGVKHLKRMWQRLRLQKDGYQGLNESNNEWEKDLMLLDLLHLGLEQTMQHLFQEAHTFDQFEHWVLEKNNGAIGPERVEHINAALSNRGLSDSPHDDPPRQQKPKYLSDEQYQFWKKNGYLVIENVLDRIQCQKTVDRIYAFLEKTPDDPDSWYRDHPAQQNIMVQLFQDPILEANRHAEIAKKVFVDLWQAENLRCSTDRVGFNPPETTHYQFSGTRLHWDLDFSRPLTVGTQGLIYLTDVAENQGAFRCVPGFHHRLKEWIHRLPAGADPNQQDLSSLPVKHIAAPAGSLIVWHPFLPHGSSPNNADTPRLVQYLNMQPLAELDMSHK